MQSASRFKLKLRLNTSAVRFFTSKYSRPLSLVANARIPLNRQVMNAGCMLGRANRETASLMTIAQFRFASLPSHKKVSMPSLSPTMEKGSIKAWKLKEGDEVHSGDVLAEVATDKATVDFEILDDGYLAKILVPEGAGDITVGTSVAILVENKEDIAAFKNFQEGAEAPQEAPKAPEAKALPKDSLKVDVKAEKNEPKKSASPSKANELANLPSHKKLSMPSLSPTMKKGNIIKWTKKEGDSIGPGEILAEVETDKATVDFEMQDEGFIAKLLRKEGDKDIDVGEPVAIIVDDKKDIDAFKNVSASAFFGAAEPVAQEGAETKEEPAQSKQEEQRQQQPQQQKAQAATPSGERKFISPLARKTAIEKGINYTEIQGTGPNGRIINADVLEFSPAQAAKPARAEAEKPKAAPAGKALPSPAEYEDVPISNIRKITAERLTFSKQNIPHYYVTIEVEVDKLLKVREQLNKFSSSKLSINDMVIKAASLACVQVPETNSSWQDTYIRRFKDVDISVAVQTDHGLITPIVKTANRKGLNEIAGEVKSLVGKAKENKLKPNEFMGGTFTISNLGMFGVHSFSAIINPPQACILAVGSVEKRVVPDESAKDPAKPYRFAQVLNVTLSSDHRIVDGALAAQWGQAFKKFIENPETMLL